MTTYNRIQDKLVASPKTWLITGVAGFIGSNLLESLLKLNQRVVGLDNFSTGYKTNLAQVESLVSPEQWTNFHFIEGDIKSLDDCRSAMYFSTPYCVNRESAEKNGAVDYVLHQAALGSVPRSLEDPIATNANNIDGFLNMLVASRDAKVLRFVYAASSSTYGDHPDLPKVEANIGRPLSPYAVTKFVNELYAEVFARSYGFNSIGLRYFNVFGRRQDPAGSYAAVIPKWTGALLEGKDIFINGDGETSRDFCFIDNVIQANVLAATSDNPIAVNQVYNIAVGERTSLNELYKLIHSHLMDLKTLPPSDLIHRDFRPGDVRHSLANIDKAKTLLGYAPDFNVRAGIALAMPWYVGNFDDGVSEN